MELQAPFTKKKKNIHTLTFSLTCLCTQPPQFMNPNLGDPQRNTPTLRRWEIQVASAGNEWLSTESQVTLQGPKKTLWSQGELLLHFTDLQTDKRVSTEAALA